MVNTTVTQRDHHVQPLTAPNRCPLLVRVIGNILRNQCTNAYRQLVHSHPSDDPTPSAADIEMTKQVATIAKPLGVHLYDHINRRQGRARDPEGAEAELTARMGYVRSNQMRRRAICDRIATTPGIQPEAAFCA